MDLLSCVVLLACAVWCTGVHSAVLLLAVPKVHFFCVCVCVPVVPCHDALRRVHLRPLGAAADQPGAQHVGLGALLGGLGLQHRRREAEGGRQPAHTLCGYARVFHTADRSEGVINHSPSPHHPPRHS